MIRRRQGFTLIELSIVLVIIGLMVSGILYGKDLIRAAALRGQMSQIETIKVATNTFKLKYGGIPGDLQASKASAFGFTAGAARDGTQCRGDGNEVIESCNGTALDWTGNPRGLNQGQGETAMFWIDLTNANGMGVNLIPGNYVHVSTYGWDRFTAEQFDLYFPRAKMADGNYLYMYSWNEKNYIGLSKMIQFSSIYIINTVPRISVLDASIIDTKMDDGLPLSGKVQTKYLNWNGFDINLNPPHSPRGDASENPVNFGVYAPDDTTATTRQSYTCFDNNGVGGATQKYSTLNGDAQNCALSFELF